MDITYYHHPVDSISFSLVAQQHIRAFRALGCKVCPVPLGADMGRQTVPSDSVALVHPLFYAKGWDCLPFNDMMRCLAGKHRAIYGFEVADGPQISAELVEWANHPDLSGIFLPSGASIAAFRDSGVSKELVLVPHGFRRVTPSDRFAYLLRQPEPTVLSFFMSDLYRKGADQLQYFVHRQPAKRFIIKTNQVDYFRNLASLPNVEVVSAWLPPADLASLYCSSDVYLSLHRGGAFELNCLEALLYGTKVVAPEFGAVLDYLDDGNAFLVKVRENSRVSSMLYPHAGSYPDLNIEHGLQQLDHACQRQAGGETTTEFNRAAYEDRYDWCRICSELLGLLEPASS
ncbi:MAG: hypothetical protein AAGI11_10290 [Pseudomonadota bacterium]